jgi:amino acid adenylation domain-containing protein
MTAPELTAPDPRTAPGTGRPLIEAHVLAAFLAVLHRSTAEERVTVSCRGGGDEARRTVTADFTAPPSFAALVALVAGQLDDGGAEGPAEAVFVSARDAFTLVREAQDRARPSPLPRWGYRVTAQGTTDPALGAALDDALRVAAADGARNPARPVPLLRLTEDEGAARAGGTGAATAPPARCVHELVARQAARTPDAVAVGQGEETLTYRRLDERADALAAVLRASGVREGDVVPVLQRRSPALVVTLLAVMKAGAAYLALDAQDAAGRNARLIRETGARLLLTDRRTPDLVPHGVRVLDLDADAPASGPDGGTPPADASRAAPSQNPDSLAYVSFTSGTTGEPRGVGVPHRAVSRLVRDPNWIDIREDDVFLLLAPVAFDASTLELWAPLANGCRLAVAPDGALELDQLATVLKEEAVSVLWLTAGLFHQMVSNRSDAFEGVRHLVAGGDTVSPGHLEQLLEAHPGLVFTNGYGPTENTTFTACWTTTSAPADGAVPIGRPVTGTRVAVLDADLRPVPAGFSGELYAAGEGLARGYVNSAAATARHFLPDVFSGVPGARMYRTGDLARWRPDGVLEFLGRADLQLKIQGFRVEPHHVESELTRMAGVRDAVVVAQPDGAGGKRLLAYVVVEDPAATADLGVRLRESLRQVLPPYAVPWAIVVVDRLPLNANGKVDRRALPVASRVPRNVGDAFVEPRDAAERGLAALWGEVLGVEPIGAEDDFFDLGGHSLLAAELLGTLKERFGVEVPARVLYLQPTIAELAEHVRNQAR